MSTGAPPELLRATAAQGMTHEAYRALVHRVVEEHRTTGPDQSEELVKYTALNKVRMERNARVVRLLPELAEALGTAPPMTWLVLTEAWCGDASQCTPVMDLMAKAAPHITLRYVLRDEHLELMDRYLTKGGRSIPKLIAFDEEGRERSTWGPRPQPAQDLVWAWKDQPEDQRPPRSRMYEQVHAWYAADRGVTMQREFLALLA